MRPSNLNVLLVDEDAAVLRMLSTWLEEAGYRVTQARNGKQALVAIETRCPDFLITEWAMAGLDGLQLCKEVRKLKLPHYVHISFLTVRSDPGDVIAGLEVGADDYLVKPIRQDELLARLRSGARVLRLERRLSQMACTDTLTGLLTRRTFYDSLAKHWERAGRYGLPLSCVMVDLDFFKRINDIHGHPAGDAVLRAVAGLMRRACRRGDAVCRHGGEEFCVMLPETGEPAAALWAEQVRRRVAAMEIPIERKRLRITASLGVAQKYDDTQTPEQLVDQADQALLCAKQSGRDRVVRFDSLSHAKDCELKSGAVDGDLFHGVTARDVMTPMVICLREDDTIGQAAEFFLRSRINSTPVVDRQQRLAGILSEKDLMAALVSLDRWTTPVREVMRPNVICYEESAPIRTIYAFLCRVSIRRVVITDGDRPTGTISQGSLVRWFRNLVFTKGLLRPDPGGDSRSAHGSSDPVGELTDPDARVSKCPMGDSLSAQGSGEPVEEPTSPGARVSKGLLGRARELDPHRSKERLVKTAGELAVQASQLAQSVLEDVDDLTAYVVGGATRMQDLVDDLLAYSRYANDTAAHPASLQSILLTSGHHD
jgi:two-component system cell cycle response regulator